MIKKRGDKFVVTNKSGTKVLGTHPSKEAAAKQLAAIEISKAKHMQHENKRFKDFRSELNESEYKETLTGYPNRGIDTDVGAVKQDADTLQKINGVLAALGRYTYQHTAEAMIKIRTRLNLFMIDFPWTPWMWQSNPTGTFTLNATLFGRVDGVDGMSGNIRFDGKASPTAGMKEFALVVTVEPAEDGFYRVNAKLQPQIAVMPEGVEHDGDSLDEMAQTPARQRDMEHAIQRAEAKAQRGYEAKMTKTGKAGERGRKQEAKHDAASRRLIARDTKEYDSPKLYGRGGKVVKGKRKPVKEEVVDEAKKMKVWTPRLDKLMNNRDAVRVTPKKKKTVKEEVVDEALIGGQKRLDVNKNKRLDAQDFAMLRAKKKPMKEYTETMGGIPLTAPDPTAARADKSGKGKRFHKGAIKSVEEAVAKGKKGKKPSPHQGAANVIGRQKSIKSTLQKHDMRW
jgi:hypothetical protein